MMTLPTVMNRHIIGVAAIVAALAILGYTANTASSRRVASLPEVTGPAIAKNVPAETPWNENFITQLKQVPPDAYGSARGSEESLGQKIVSGIKAVLPSVGSNSAQTESKGWSDEDWQIAEQAVAEHRRTAKNKNSSNASARSDTVWQPPEEIANGQGNQSR